MSESAVDAPSAPPAPSLGAQTPDIKPLRAAKHIPALDGIRGLAILLVFCVHFLWASSYSGRNPIIWTIVLLRSGGGAGVNLFFVLSGFLITGILYDTRKSQHFFRNFYARRALRIFPLYYASIALGCLIVYLSGGHVNGTQLVRLLTYTRSLFLGPVVPLVTGSVVNFDHYWTLALEELFYFVWPLIVFFLQTKRKIATAAVIGIVISIVCQIVLNRAGYSLINPFVTRSWPLADMDGLCLGGLLAVGMRSRWEALLLRWSPAVLVVCAVALALMGVPMRNLYTQESWNVTYWALQTQNIFFAALIAGSLRAQSVLKWFFSLGFMRFFGRYSYGLYIFHYTIATLSIQYREPIAARFHSKTLGFFIPLVIGVAASILIAMLSFRFFEAPILRLKKFFADPRPVAQ